MSKSYQPKSPAWSSGAHRAQYVIEYGIGGNPFGVDVFGSAMQLFDKIAARVFGLWRSDASPANAHDGTCAISTAAMDDLEGRRDVKQDQRAD